MANLALHILTIGVTALCARRLILSIWGSRLFTWLEQRGIIWTDISLAWEVSTLNALFSKIGNPHGFRARRFLDFWFTAGAVFGPFAQLLSNILIAWNLLNMVKVLIVSESISDTVNASIIYPLTPSSSETLDFYIFWGAAGVAFLIHECGHALAATRQQLRVFRSGIFVTCLFPGMYVKIEDLLIYTPAASQLIVFAAGIWHNFVLCVFCYFVICGGFEPLAKIFYSKGSGVTVSHVSTDGALFGTLEIADILVSIDGVPVIRSQDILDILIQCAGAGDGNLKLNRGICVEHPDIGKPAMVNLSSTEDITDCCTYLYEEKKYMGDDASHCYLTEEQHGVVVNGKEYSDFINVFGEPWYFVGCMDTVALAAEASSNGMCLSSTDCSDGEEKMEMSCIRPLTPLHDILVEIGVRRDGTDFSFLFEGDVDAFMESIRITDYSPHSFLAYLFPQLIRSLSKLPTVLDLFFRMLLQLSSSMAIANAASIKYLDGEQITRQSLRLMKNAGNSYRISVDSYSNEDFPAKILVYSITFILAIDLTLCISSAIMRELDS